MVGFWNSAFIVLIFYVAYIGFNTFFSNYVIRKISHPKFSLPINDLGSSSTPYSTMVFFIGVFLLPFSKRIRKKRIKEFYDTVKNDSFYNLVVTITPEEFKTLERKIKLDNIKKLSKKKKFKKIITFQWGDRRKKYSMI